jgi:hypothetical protein
LLAAESDAAAPLEWGTCTASSAEAERSGDLDDDIATPARTSPESSGGGFTRQRAELRVRLDQRKGAMRRAQADVRDGEAKAFVAHGRGDNHMARHFERRVEADRSRVCALLGEVSGLELELHGLEACCVDGQGRATQISSESESDSAERLKRDVQSMHGDEFAALRRKYENDSSRR